MRRTLGLLLGMALCLTAADAKSERYFLKIAGIPGNTVFQSDPGWIPIDGYEAESAGACDGWVKCYSDGAPVALIVRRHHDEVSDLLKAAAEDQRLLPDLMIVYYFDGGGTLPERTGFGSVQLSDFRLDGDKETFRLSFARSGDMSGLIDGPFTVFRTR